MRRVSLYAVLALLLCAFVSPSQSSADGIDDFTLSDGLGNTITWQLPASPTPAFVTPFVFQLFNVPGTINGIGGETLNPGFVNQNAGGGIFVGNATDTIGIVGETVIEGATFPQLYSGPQDAPTFLTGTFSFPVLTAINELNEGITSGTLTITPDVTAVPEPSTVTLFAAGLLGMGAILLGKLR